MNPLAITLRDSAVVGLLVVTLAGSVGLPRCAAQSSRDRRDQVTEKQLEIRLEKAEGALVQELAGVAAELYKQGSRERALEVLEKLQQIRADVPGVKEKIDEIREELLSDNEMILDVDVSRGWGNPLALVAEGRPLRLSATGEYRFTLTETVPVTGLPTDDPAQHHVQDAPFGALMGVVVTDGKPGKPFAVNDGMQFTPKKDGQLFMRVNVPATARCTGKLSVKLSGYVQPIPRTR